VKFSGFFKNLKKQNLDFSGFLRFKKT